MRITYKGDYALKILLDLTVNYQQNHSEGLVQIKDISKRQDIPVKYLEQIILTLKGAGYIRSKRGSSGGVGLAKPPEKIKLGEVIRLMDGTTAPITCVSRTEHTKCDFFQRCPFKPLWTDIRDYVNNIVDNTTFADIAKKYKASGNCLDYTI
ncbi:MAG: hypothetical protein A2252_01205 [Elusimicrobia bacterium RIFOXYA2_FULL_39_19]|nr:MAG: hypothetical protein A2252_01205 [Elusimicrobia bacterium RIFOXYA2_FULL_39_19]